MAQFIDIYLPNKTNCENEMTHLLINEDDIISVRSFIQGRERKTNREIVVFQIEMSTHVYSFYGYNSEPVDNFTKIMRYGDGALPALDCTGCYKLIIS